MIRAALTPPKESLKLLRGFDSEPFFRVGQALAAIIMIGVAVTPIDVPATPTLPGPMLTFATVVQTSSRQAKKMPQMDTRLMLTFCHGPRSFD